MHAAEEQHDERAGRDAEARAIAAGGLLRRVEVDAVRHHRDRHAELEIADARRLPVRRSRAAAPRLRDCGARAANTPPPSASGRAASPAAAACPAATRRTARRRARARRRRPPLRHVPHAVDVADVGAGERGRQRPRAAARRRTAAGMRPPRSGPARRRTRRRRAATAAAAFGRWPSWSRPRRRCRRAEGPGTSRGSRPAARRY